VLLADVVAVSETLRATTSRTAKLTALADLLRRLSPSEVPAAVGFLAGEPRQGKIGVGWATLTAIQPEPAATPLLTVEDLDLALTRIQETTGTGSVVERARQLQDLLGRATAGESDFVRRLLVGELRQGALDGVMGEAIARAAGVPPSIVRRASMLSGDLRETARLALEGGASALQGIGLRVLRPLLPMLASTAESVEEALAETKLSSVEWKIDGVRIQVHRSGDEVRIFTRNLNDATDRLPDVVAIARSLPASQFVLDGEALWPGESGMPRGFKDLMSQFGRLPGRAAAEIVAFFFDCLHVEGADLIDRPLLERLEHLAALAGEWRVPSITTADPATAARSLDAALAAGHEGVMVKAANSTYQAGRRGKAWKKVKAAKTLDLVVIGAEWGHGRRQGWLSNLHLGAIGSDGRPVMVGKTFKGLTDELLRWQTEQLLRLETGRSGIVVFVRAELVVEIELDGAMASTRYPGGVALRFARVRRYRPDKTVAEADTIDAVRRLAAGGEKPEDPML
jgi:DNA ligase-1